MSGDQVTITQTGTPLDYLRLWDNSATAFIDLDAESKSVAGTPQELWDQAADILYAGNDSTFAYIGFLPDTAGDYGAFTFEYAASGSYAITGVNQGTKTFTIAESKASQFTDGTHFTISGSTGNDGTYTVNGDATGTTDIIVDQAIPDATVDGNISTIWTCFNDDVKQNGTDGFAQRGYIAFPIPGDWTLRTIDSQSAFWVRALVASVATTATMLHMMRSLVIDQVLTLPSSLGAAGSRLTRDINGGLGRKDRGYKGVRQAWIDMTPVSVTGAELNLLLDWEKELFKLFIEDSRQSVPIDFTVDSYYKTYTGRLDKMPNALKSMEKMVGTDYRMLFELDAFTSLSTTLGLSA